MRVHLRPSSRRHRARLIVAALAMVASSVMPVGGSTLAASRLEGVVSISAGGSNTCALLVSTRAKCWGYNEDGELGDGTTVERHLPRTVVNSAGTGPLTGIAKVAVGGTHTCFVLTSHRARCTGYNAYGHLGDGTTDDRMRPTTVQNPAGTGPLRDVVAIAPGYTHTCAVLESGQARCWGQNDDGQLGDGTTDERHRPVVVRRVGGAALTGVVAIAAGTDHTCALLSSHKVRCWGAAAQLGDGSGAERPLAGFVLDPPGTGHLTGVRSIDAGESSTCARLSTQRVVCWGSNSLGQLGDGTDDPRPRPVKVKNPSGTASFENVAQVSVGGSFACVRTTSSRVHCWGYNGDRQLGDGSTEDHRALPAPVLTASGPKLGDVAQVSAGVGFVCARLVNGRARCWGDNDSGVLGDGTTDPRPFPVFVES